MTNTTIRMRLALVGALAVAAALAELCGVGQAQGPASTTPAAENTTATPSQPAASDSAVSPAEQAAAEQAIRGEVAEFTKAFNAGDAKAAAGLFTADGEITAEDGTSHQGRDAIEREFASDFKEHPKATIKDEILSIRLVTPTMAVEEGNATVVNDPEQPPERSSYEAIHVKENGQWRMASARDLPGEQLSGVDELQQLHWLIGDWVDESPDSTVHTSYRWSDDHHFIVSDFSANIQGQLAIQGTQRIGWDPVAKTIRSWAFDSEGGFLEGTWTRNDRQWIIENKGVTADGKTASSTSTLTHLHNHRMIWESHDRIVGGEKTPDLGPITIARQAPAPGTAVPLSPVHK